MTRMLPSYVRGLLMLVSICGKHIVAMSSSSSTTTATTDTILPRTRQPQTPYLKEILLGRCYQHPPTGSASDASLCPFLVGSFLSVLESQPDADIDMDSFWQYWGWANVRVPIIDAALLVWPPLILSQPPAPYPKNDTLVMPETTPGGWMVHGLVFCGVDRQLEDCPVPFFLEDHGGGASFAFWKSLYLRFAASVRGRLRAVLQHDSSQAPSLWMDQVIPSLEPDQVVSFELYYNGDCGASVAVKQLQQAIDKQQIPFSCMEVSSTSSSAGMGAIMQTCPVQAILSLLPSANQTDPTTSNSIGSTPDDACDCATNPVVECTSRKDEELGIYAVLFWALVVLLGAVGVAWYSIHVHLPPWNGYQTLPDAQDAQQQPFTTFPKQ